MTDLDKSGRYYQQEKVYLGPSLGWAYTQVKPQRSITATGSYSLTPEDSMVFVNVAAVVTILLPSVVTWINTYAKQFQAAAWEQAIWIKDLGGNAAGFNITVTPSGVETIDLLAQSFTIVQPRQLLRLYPLNDLSGWYSG